MKISALKHHSSRMLGGLIVVLGGLLLFGILSVFLLLFYHRRTWPHVMVGNVAVGNLPESDVEDVLRAEMIEKPWSVTVTYEDTTWEVSASDIGYLPDVQATAQKAVRSGKHLLHSDSWETILNGTQLGWSYHLNDRDLERLVDEISQEVTVVAVKPDVGVDIDGNVWVEPGGTGYIVNEAALLETLRSRMEWRSTDSVPLSVQMIDLRLSANEQESVRRRAEAILDTRLVFADETNEWTWGGERIATLLDLNMDGFDRERIKSAISELATEVSIQPENAVFEFDAETGKVKEFKSEIVGIVLEEDVLIEQVEDSLSLLASEATTEASLVLPLAERKPEITVADVNDLGIVELIGEGESYFKGSIPGRIHNIALAASRLNGALIPPGEEISFNELVGEISGATGYQSSYVIQNGRTVLGDGGGVCQVSSTLFRAALNTGLPIIERRAHSYRVGYYEQESYPGFDATIYSPVVDLKAMNDTDGYILVETVFDKENSHLVFKLYGKSDGREVEISNMRTWGVVPPPEPLYQDDPTLPAGSVRQIEHAAWGAKAAFDWKVTRDGEVLQDRTFTSNFRPWQAVYLRGVGG